MNLLDGLAYFKNYDDSDWQFTLKVETAAAKVVKIISGPINRSSPSALAAAHDLLIDIEKWKAMCMKERMGNAEKNSPRDVWDAFRGALAASNDLDAILSIMQLKGFGSSSDEETGQRRAKVATAALRFLKPDDWGVVDWRTIAMLGILHQASSNVAEALVLAKKENAAELRRIFDLVDEKGACQVNAQYRLMRTPYLPRTVDVEMAIFGLSVMAWPFKAQAASKVTG